MTELVIKLPEEVIQAFSEALETHSLDVSTTNAILDAVANGVPLPKRHGRLIDADRLPLDAIDAANYGSNYVRTAETIIKADTNNESIHPAP